MTHPNQMLEIFKMLTTTFHQQSAYLAFGKRLQQTFKNQQQKKPPFPWCSLNISEPHNFHYIAKKTSPEQTCRGMRKVKIILL